MEIVNPTKDIGFEEWLLKSMDPTAKGAWVFQEHRLRYLRKEFMDKFGEATGWAKGEIESTLRRQNDALKAASKKIKELEGKNAQLLKEIEQYGR